MNSRFSAVLKYLVPALLIILTTSGLVGIALKSMYGEKQHQLTMLALVVKHQITSDPKLSSALQYHNQEQLESDLQPLIDDLIVDGNPMQASLYLPDTQRVVAASSRQQLSADITAPIPMMPEMRQVYERRTPDFFATFIPWRTGKSYTYIDPLLLDNRVVALVSIDMPYSAIQEQSCTIWFSGVTVCLLALLFLTVAAVSEYRRTQRLRLEQANLIRWLKDFNDNHHELEAFDTELTFLRQLPTEFKNAIQLVQLERKQKLQVLDHLALGILTLDKTGQITYANPFFAHLIGYDQETITLWSVEEWRTKYRLTDGGYLGLRFEGGEPIENKLGMLFHKDGHEIPFSISVRGLDDESGQRLGFLLMFSDLSQQFELHRTTQKTQHLFMAISLSVILLDAARKIEYINPAVSRLFGKSDHELVGQCLQEALPWAFPFQEQYLFEQIEHVLQSGMRSRLTNVKTLILGRDYDLEFDLFPIMNPFTDAADGCMVLIKDMTLYREWEELSQRVDAHSHYVQMAATIAHEVRNPMTSVRGFLQLLSGHLVSDQQRMYLDVMQMEIDRMNAILSEYLSMARPPQPEREFLNLTELVRDTFLLLEGEANYRGIAMKLFYDEDCPFNGLSRELKQVLINLVRNAFDAVDNKHGLIEIRLTTDEQWCRVHVIDNGCGIPAEQLPRIFDPFFTTKAMGTGLGLPVCKKIIESHGGSLLVSSSLGAGTTFTIELPKYV